MDTTTACAPWPRSPNMVFPRMQTKNKAGQSTEFGTLTVVRPLRTTGRFETLAPMKRTAKPATRKPRQPPQIFAHFGRNEALVSHVAIGTELLAVFSKSMFGFLFFYRGNTVFAGLPRTRGFDWPWRLILKVYSMEPALRERGKADSRIYASRKASSDGWFS